MPASVIPDVFNGSAFARAEIVPRVLRFHVDGR